MGCFCEKLSAGDRVRHVEVVHGVLGKVLGMTGALGPLAINRGHRQHGNPAFSDRRRHEAGTGFQADK